MRVLGGELRRQRDAVVRLRAGFECAVLDAVEGGDEQPGARFRQPQQQVAGGVGRRDRLGDHPEVRPGVHALLEPEGRRAGHVVAGEQRVLHRSGAAPGRQQREVQVDPPMNRDVERRPRQQRPVRHDRAAVGRDLRQPFEELGLARALGVSTSSSASRASRLTGEIPSLRPRPAGASGRVRTATTSWRSLSSSARRLGSAGTRSAREDQAHRLERPAEERVGADLHRGRRLAEPLGLADRRLGLLGRHLVQPVDEDDAVEMVGLVLQQPATGSRCPR
jgi:hypothetical protein